MFSHPPAEQLGRIISAGQHMNLLKEVLTYAKSKVVITTRGVSHQQFIHADLYRLFEAAVSRGVKIYLYYSDLREVDHGAREFLDRHGVKHRSSFTHSKILVQDNRLFAIGSFNWLANCTYGNDENATLIYRGNQCQPLIEKSWQFIRHAAVTPQESQFASSQPSRYDIGGTQLHYLTTLIQQRGFLKECFRIAKRRLIICSPFVTEQFNKDIDTNMLREAVSRGVNVYFLCLPDQEYSINEFLKRCNLHNTHLIVVPNFHSKTIIVDECVLSDGSFNWLSADRNPNGAFYSHEAALVVSGANVPVLADQFFRSNLGRELLAYISQVDLSSRMRLTART